MKLVIHLAQGDLSPIDTKPPSGDILRDSFRMAFPDVVRLGFSNVDHIVLGDSDHGDYRQVWDTLGSPETMAAVAESGAPHMFLELPYYRQGLVDEFQSKVAAGEAVNVGEFAQRFEHEDDVAHNISQWRFRTGEETQTFLQNSVAPLLVNATRFGVDVNMLDHENGRNQFEARNDARKAVIETRDEIVRIRDTENASDPSVAARLTQLRGQFQDQKAAYMQSRLDYYSARFDDQNLAQTVNGVAQGQKSLTMLGFVHGSRLNDFEEYLQGGALKIDIATSRASYEQDYAQRMDTINAVSPAFGNDPPELVYFIDEGVLATTVNTPPALARQIENIASGAPDITPNDTDPDQTPKIDTGMKWN